MKIWMHIGAAIVGFALAGVIVFVVFGNASRDGATQEGVAPGGLDASGGTLCGSIAPSATSSPAARASANEHPPAVVDEDGRQISISAKAPKQRAWLASLHAAGGLCIDEVRIDPAKTTVSMSTLAGVSDNEASAYAAGALVAAHRAPLQRPVVDVVMFVDDQQRALHMSSRAYRAWLVWQRSNAAATTVASLQRFQASSGFRPADLRITGWS